MSWIYKIWHTLWFWPSCLASQVSKPCHEKWSHNVELHPLCSFLPHPLPCYVQFDHIGPQYDFWRMNSPNNLWTIFVPPLSLGYWICWSKLAEYLSISLSLSPSFWSQKKRIVRFSEASDCVIMLSINFSKISFPC